MNWKIATVILILVILVLSFNLYLNYTKSYKIGNFEIRKSALNDISETVGNEFAVCNFNGNCVKFVRLE